MQSALDGDVGALLIVSALASVIATPFLHLIGPTVLDFGKGNFGIVAHAVLEAHCPDGTGRADLFVPKYQASFLAAMLAGRRLWLLQVFRN